jgi:thioredoxin-like negative regulator of GroEL
MIEPLLEAERLLAVGLLDQAERRFAQVAEADPRNSIAVVGLARVALERGDDAGALALAKRAAGIDPDNPAAAGMIARLQEIAGAGATAAAAPPGSAPPDPGGSAPARPLPGPDGIRPPPSPRPPAPRRRRRGLLGRILGRD